VITRGEVLWILNGCDWHTRLDELVTLIELGDLFFDDDYNLRATNAGRAKLRVLPRNTD
jgi:hypothetical protein